MAKGESIWIVTYAYGGPDIVLGAFTWKWRLQEWLKAQPDPSCYLIKLAVNGDMENMPQIMRAVDVLTS